MDEFDGPKIFLCKNSNDHFIKLDGVDSISVHRLQHATRSTNPFIQPRVMLLGLIIGGIK